MESELLAPVMRSVLITGGSGSFGQAFARRALEIGCERVCVFSRGEHAQAAMRAAFNNERLRFFIGDVRDRDRLRRAFDGVDLVVHAAALKRIEVGHYDPIEMTKTNILGTVNVIEAATDARVKAVIGLSSDKAYQPVSPYGCSKAMAESLLLAANNMRGSDGPTFSAVRYGNIWQSNGSVVPRWREMIQSGASVVPLTDPDCTRFFMRIGEAVQLVLKTAHDQFGGVLAIPDYLPAYRLGDLAEAMGVKTDVIGLPKWEKRHESMRDGLCSADAPRMSVNELRVALAA